MQKQHHLEIPEKQIRRYNLAYVNRNSPKNHDYTMKTIKEQSLSEINTLKNIENSTSFLNKQKKLIPKCLSQQRPYNIFKASDLYTQSIRQNCKIKNRLNLLKQNIYTDNNTLMKNSQLEDGQYSVVARKQCLNFQDRLKKNKYHTHSYYNRHKFSESHLSFSKVSTINQKTGEKMNEVSQQDLKILFNLGNKNQGKIKLKKQEDTYSNYNKVEIYSSLNSSLQKIHHKHDRYKKQWNKISITSCPKSALDHLLQTTRKQRSLKENKQNILSRFWPSNLRTETEFANIYGHKMVQKIIVQNQSMKLKGNRKLRNQAQWLDQKCKNNNVVLKPLKQFGTVLDNFKKQNKEMTRIETDPFENQDKNCSKSSSKQKAYNSMIPISSRRQSKI